MTNLALVAQGQFHTVGSSTFDDLQEADSEDAAYMVLQSIAEDAIQSRCETIILHKSLSESDHLQDAINQIQDEYDLTVKFVKDVGSYQ